MFERIKRLLELPELIESLGRDFLCVRREMLSAIDRARRDAELRPELAILMFWGNIAVPGDYVPDGFGPHDKIVRPGIVSRETMLIPGGRATISFQPDTEILVQRWMLFAPHDCFVREMCIANISIASVGAKCGDTSVRCSPANRITAHLGRAAR